MKWGAPPFQSLTPAEKKEELQSFLEKWTPAERQRKQRKGEILEVDLGSGSAVAFDPWEKRNDFFKLVPGDMEGLLGFLAQVGFFDKPDLTDCFGKTSSISGPDGEAYK